MQGPNRHSVRVVGRKIDADMLVGTHEIAERLRLGRYQRVHDFRRRDPGFPPPVAQLKQAMIWYWPDVQSWAQARGRLPGQAHASRR